MALSSGFFDKKQIRRIIRLQFIIYFKDLRRCFTASIVKTVKKLALLCLSKKFHFLLCIGFDSFFGPKFFYYYYFFSGRGLVAHA